MTSLKTTDTTEKSLEDFRSNITDVGLLNGKIIPNSALDLGKITASSTMKTDSLHGVSSIDLPKFPPHNYLSALSNFGFHGLPNLPDINSQPPSLHPRFASNLANLMEKSSSDVTLRKIDDIIGINLSGKKSMSPTIEDPSQAATSDTQIKCPSSSASS